MEKELILLIDCRLILLWRDDELVDGVVSLAHDRKRERGHLVRIAPQIRIAHGIFYSALFFRKQPSFPKKKIRFKRAG